MKRISTLLLVLLMFSTILLPISANADGITYAFSLLVNGQDTVEVNTGDIITLTLQLHRTDEAAPYSMYGMQAELRYDSSFLALVENSNNTYQGVSVKDISVTENYRELYMNFLSMSGGTQWDSETVVGTVQFKVIGESGVTKITNEDFLVSLSDGSGSYPCTSNEVLLILTTDCTLRFMSSGGSEVAEQIVQYGEKGDKPTEPVRDGFRFEGWYTDIHLTDEWDFDVDTVQGNMTLYAKWSEGEDVVVENIVQFPWPYLAVGAIVGIIIFIFVIIFIKNRNK